MATVVAGSPLRAVAWRRPRSLRRPEPINMGLARLEAALARRGPIWDALESTPLPSGQRRSRKLRRDGARNLISLLQAILASTDLVSGMVASPAGEGRWDRHDWGRLDHRAYGPLVERERSFRRTERHARELAALGFVSVVQLKTHGASGWKSEVAFKRLTPAAIALLGLESAQRRARRERDARKNQAQREVLARVVKAPKVPRGPRRLAGTRGVSPVTTQPPAAALPRPPDPGGGLSPAAAAAMVQLAEVFSLRKRG